MNKIKILTFIIALISFSGCKDEDEASKYIFIHNATDKTIYVYGNFVQRGSTFSVQQIDKLVRIPPYLRVPFMTYMKAGTSIDFQLYVYGQEIIDMYTLDEIKEKEVDGRRFLIPVYEIETKGGLIVVEDDVS